jgi:hypothetical protein
MQGIEHRFQQSFFLDEAEEMGLQTGGIQLIQPADQLIKKASIHGIGKRSCFRVQGSGFRVQRFKVHG